MSESILELEGVRKYFEIEKGFLAKLLSKSEKFVRAVDDVSFRIVRGETFSLVGETGSGKTTIAKLIVRLHDPTEGHIYFGGNDVAQLHGEELKGFRKKVQMIFQDPYASLNPRMTVENIVGLPLESQGIAESNERREMVIQILEQVGLSPAEQIIDRNPHEFSGGQRQRIGVARALVLRPSLIVADEPVSALDVSVRAQILNLMKDIKGQFGLTYIFVAHDLAVVRYMSDWVMIMYQGKQMELARTEDLFNSPLHPYTKALIDAVPSFASRKRKRELRLKGEMASPINIPSGCRFHPRCPFALPVCSKEEPQTVAKERGHVVSCHLHA